ncbi:HAD-IA family hydrolase [Paracoccus aestuariivivens]|uniref:HAD-IA family hydrolase n=1 Tax=Paracoccus aestuariivivens TaxID=1820333 RepID=A0A6L6JAQ5_9RHOB|nr:HAD-IA family hydrolase [Paracoccus aestuariivivens]MTH77779.1 HAD-IA family hydrolase [Paracoccus aestuariivivens]
MRLVVFDVDGTLVNSQHEIVEAMNYGLRGVGLPEMQPQEILSIVGLSLPVAIARLLPGATPDLHERVVLGYREAFVAARAKGVVPPLYAGALDCLDALAAQDDVLLGIATGKPMRGLMAVLEAHGLTQRFVTRQTADGHPSKPHPAMLESALSETGVAASRTAMVGDTVFDIEMARAAGVTGFGVDWGYHPTVDLHGAGAALVAPDYPSLTQSLLEWTKQEQVA